MDEVDEMNPFLEFARKLMLLLLTALLAAAAGGIVSFLVGGLIEALAARYIMDLELQGVRAVISAIFGAMVGAVGGIVARIPATNDWTAAAKTIFRFFVYIEVGVTVVFVPALIHYRLRHGRLWCDNKADGLMVLYSLSLVTVIAGAIGGLVGRRSIRNNPLRVSRLDLLVGIGLFGLAVGLAMLGCYFG